MPAERFYAMDGTTIELWGDGTIWVTPVGKERRFLVPMFDYDQGEPTVVDDVQDAITSVVRRTEPPVAWREVARAAIRAFVKAGGGGPLEAAFAERGIQVATLTLADVGAITDATLNTVIFGEGYIERDEHGRLHSIDPSKVKVERKPSGNPFDVMSVVEEVVSGGYKGGRLPNPLPPPPGTPGASANLPASVVPTRERLDDVIRQAVGLARIDDYSIDEIVASAVDAAFKEPQGA